MTASKARELTVRAWQAVSDGRFTATGFIVWLFAGIGIPLQDDLLALHLTGEVIVGSDLEPADLVFRTGRVNAFHAHAPMHGVGHVGLYTGYGVVIHVSPRSSGRIVPSSMDWFLDMDGGHFRGVRRLIARS